MASTISSWFSSTFRHFNPFVTLEQIDLSANKRCSNPSSSTPDPNDPYRAIPPSPTTTTHPLNSPSPEISPGIHILPEYSSTPQPEAVQAAGSISRGVSSRLDLAVQEALNRSVASVTSPIVRASEIHKIYTEGVADHGDDFDGQLQEQIQIEALKGVVAAMRPSGQGVSRAASVYESEGEAYDDDAWEAAKPVYSLSWRVDEDDNVTRAAVVKTSSEHREVTRGVLRSAGSRASKSLQEDSAVIPGVLLESSTDVVKVRTPVQKLIGLRDDPVHLTATLSPAVSNISRKRKLAPAPAPAKFTVKKLKPIPRSFQGLVAKPKMAPKAHPASVVESKTVPGISARPARHAAKMANKATKSALWREALHHDTFLKRVDNGGGKKKGKRN